MPAHRHVMVGGGEVSVCLWIPSWFHGSRQSAWDFSVLRLTLYESRVQTSLRLPPKEPFLVNVRIHRNLPDCFQKCIMTATFSGNSSYSHKQQEMVECLQFIYISFNPGKKLNLGAKAWLVDYLKSCSSSSTQHDGRIFMPSRTSSQQRGARQKSGVAGVRPRCPISAHS